MTVTFDPVQLVIGGAAVLVAVGLLARKLHQLDRVLHAAAAIVHRELNRDDPEAAAGIVRKELRPNGGTSVKDDTAGIAVAVGYLGREFDQLREDFDNHLQDHHQESA